MSYIMLEGVVCVVIAAGIATLVLASSLVVMLARQGIANVFRGRSRAPSQTTHFGGRDLDDIVTEGKGLPSSVISFVLFFVDGDIDDIVPLRQIVEICTMDVPGENADHVRIKLFLHGTGVEKIIPSSM